MKRAEVVSASTVVVVVPSRVTRKPLSGTPPVSAGAVQEASTAPWPYGVGSAESSTSEAPVTAPGAVQISPVVDAHGDGPALFEARTSIT